MTAQDLGSPACSGSLSGPQLHTLLLIAASDRSGEGHTDKMSSFSDAIGLETADKSCPSLHIQNEWYILHFGIEFRKLLMP
jgi:hypothetical protein